MTGMTPEIRNVTSVHDRVTRMAPMAAIQTGSAARTEATEAAAVAMIEAFSNGLAMRLLPGSVMTMAGAAMIR
jgi:hypothetical protein